LAKLLHHFGFQLLIIDTENQFISSGFAKEIAREGSGSYYYLPSGVMSNTRMSSFTNKAVHDSLIDDSV
jgi:magnesium chelatase subunit D